MRGSLSACSRFRLQARPLPCPQSPRAGHGRKSPRAGHEPAGPGGPRHWPGRPGASRLRRTAPALRWQLVEAPAACTGCSEGPGRRRRRQCWTRSNVRCVGKEDTPWSADRGWPSCAELAGGDRNYGTSRSRRVPHARRRSIGPNRDRYGPVPLRPTAEQYRRPRRQSRRPIGRSAAPLHVVAHTRCGRPRLRPRRRRDLLRLHPPRRPASVGAVPVRRYEGTP